MPKYKIGLVNNLSKAKRSSLKAIMNEKLNEEIITISSLTASNEFINHLFIIFNDGSPEMCLRWLTK